MVQRVYRQLMSVDQDSWVTIATSAKQVSTLRNQLSQDVDISLEPCKRNNFPAIALAAAYQCDVIMNACWENVHVINELRVPVLAMGLKNVVALRPEGVLVADWNDSTLSKPFVDTIDQHIRFAEKP